MCKLLFCYKHKQSTNEISIVDCGVGRSIKYSHYILYLRTASLVNAGPIPHHSRNMSAVGVFYFSRSFSRDHSVGELHLAQDPIVKACWLLFVDGEEVSTSRSLSSTKHLISFCCGEGF
ncbi:hypothetical protein Plhal304r1_c012g0045591 [Plasmopara halstedii]